MKNTIGLIFLLLVLAVCCPNAASAQETNLLEGYSAGTALYGRMSYQSGRIYLAGRALTYAEMEQVMPLDLYKQGSGGLRMRNSGKRLIIAGSVLAGVGAVLITSGFGAAMYESGAAPALLYLGVLSSVPGYTCLSAGIPLYCVGQSRARRASATYNARAESGQLTLNWGAAGNGLGFYLNF